MSYDLILVNGAPGVGKTILSKLLGEYFESPVYATRA
ncbi:AAA family ATPase [Oligoflexia bacterium]|nr:AAA family ATPase [Oligoflexia bacterium]